MAQEHPTAAAMDSFIGCRLRSLKPSKPSNSSKSLPNSAGKRHPTAAAIASFIGVQGCHLPGLKGSKRSTPSNASTLRSGLTRSIVGALRRLPTFGTRTLRSRTTHSVVGGSRVPFASLQTFIQTVTPSAAALHTVLLRPQDHRLLAFDP